VTVSEGTFFNRDQWSLQLSPIVQLWQKLTSNNDILKPDSQKRVEHENPLDIFVTMEYEFSKGLAQFVNGTIGNVMKVISGAMLLSPSIQAVGTSLLRGAVPSEWSDKWEGPDNPYEWLRQLVTRALALESWKQRAESGTLFNQAILLSDLFRPDTLLNALRQQTARLTKRSIDTLKLVATWDPRLLSSSKPPLTVQIDGLLLQGCNFDGEKLFDASADGPELLAIPKCTIAWIGKDEKDPYSEDGSVLIPLYATTTRERLISQMYMPCAVGDKMKWVQAGVAMCLSDR